MTKKATTLLLSLLLPLCAFAQIENDFDATSPWPGDDRKGRLELYADNLFFFQNNEFKTMADGYSLPGLWIRPRLVYYPLENLKIEAGAHLLFYNGAVRYPAGTYSDFPGYDGDDGKKVHARPFFRAHLASKDDKLHIVFGNIYGGSFHRLIEPLYNPEQNLTADPENGLQALFRSARFDADAWIDWKDFIFKDDDHQERFVVALSSDIKLNDPQKPLHWHIPLQIVGQHIGGEVQADEHHGISSIANVAAGIGLTWNARRGVLKSISAESHFVGYKQLSGSSLPINDGYGWHNAVSARLGDFFVKAGHMNSRKFVSILGSPFFGSMSETDGQAVFKHSQLLYGKAEYSKRLKRVGAIGINLTLYQSFPGSGIDATGETVGGGSQASIQAGVYLRINPSLLLHKF